MEISFNKFNDIMVDGRPTHQLSDSDLIKAYEETTDTLVKAMLAELVAARLKRYTPKTNESEDESIGRIFEDMVNGRISSLGAVAKRMARSHRYLQQQLFYLCTAYIKELADAYDNGHYDDRNKYACEKCKQIVESCFEVSPNGMLY